MLSEDHLVYLSQNLDLTNNDQIWTGSIAGLRNLERRRGQDFSASNRVLFNQLQMGFIDLCPNFDPPMDATTRVMRYSAILVEWMWTMVDEEHSRVGPATVPLLM